MKKNLFIVVLMATMMLLSGCDANKAINYAKLKMQLEKQQSTLPIPIEGLGKLVKMELNEEDKVVEIAYEIDNELFDVDNLKGNEDLIKKNTMGSLKQSAGSKEIAQECIKSGVGLRIIFIDKNSQKRISISTSNEELETFMKSDITVSPREMLQNSVAMEQRNMPQQVDEVTTLVGAKLEGDNLVYEYTILEEDDFTLNDVDKDAFISSIKSGVLENNNVILKKQFDMCKSANVNLVFHYTGSKTKKVIEVNIPYTDLP